MIPIRGTIYNALRDDGSPGLGNEVVKCQQPAGVVCILVAVPLDCMPENIAFGIYESLTGTDPWTLCPGGQISIPISNSIPQVYFFQVHHSQPYLSGGLIGNTDGASDVLVAFVIETALGPVSLRAAP